MLKNFITVGKRIVSNSALKWQWAELGRETSKLLKGVLHAINRASFYPCAWKMDLVQSILVFFHQDAQTGRASVIYLVSFFVAQAFLSGCFVMRAAVFQWH